MLHTYDRSQWVEDAEAERERKTFTASTPKEMVRKQYPYRVIVKRGSHAYQLRAGDTLEFARTKHAVGFFPIEAITFFDSGNESRARFMYLGSEEVDLIEV